MFLKLAVSLESRTRTRSPSYILNVLPYLIGLNSFRFNVFIVLAGKVINNFFTKQGKCQIIAIFYSHLLVSGEKAPKVRENIDGGVNPLVLRYHTIPSPEGATENLNSLLSG